MKTNKKIAILMSVYNGESYLSEQIESISNQTVSDYITLFIRDDGSTDRTLEIINTWKDKISIVVFKESNVGPAKSFWRLFTKDIEADYYLFCDQDDVWDNNKVERSIASLEQGACLSFCNCRHINQEGMVIQEKRTVGIPDSSYENLFICGITQGCSMCFTKELRDYILSKNIDCIPMHDIIVMLYAITYGKISWIEEPLFSYRIHNSNVVAKNKNPFVRVRKTIWNWRNSRNNSMADVAKELIENVAELEKNDFLVNMSKYRSELSAKKSVLKNPKLKNTASDCKRSYICRIILNLL